MIDVGGKKLFACDECSIVKQLELRMALSIEHPEYGEFQFDHCGCDKVQTGRRNQGAARERPDGRTDARCGFRNATDRWILSTSAIRCHFQPAWTEAASLHPMCGVFGCLVLRTTMCRGRTSRGRNLPGTKSSTKIIPIGSSGESVLFSRKETSSTRFLTTGGRSVKQRCDKDW